MKFHLATLVLLLLGGGAFADELPVTDLLHWRVPVAPQRLPPPEPAMIDECTVNKNSAVYQQTLVYLSGLKVKSDETSRWRPYVAGICPGAEAATVGFREGDILRSITPVPLDKSIKAYPTEIYSVQNFEELLFQYRGKPIETMVLRNEAQIMLPSFVPRTSESSRRPASIDK